MYIKFCNFGPYADAKVFAESKEEVTTDVYRRVRLYKRISAVFILLSLLLLAVVLALAMKLYGDQSIQNCPEIDDTEELYCSRQLCQTMYPPTQTEQNQEDSEVSEVQSSEKCPDLAAELKKMQDRPPIPAWCQCTECRKGWVRFENSCYLISRERLRWQESREVCWKHGGDLVVINNERVQKFLAENSRMLYWIGLRNAKEQKQWMWINNTAPTQSYWSHGQPDPDSHNFCAVLNGGTSYMNNWLSKSCEVYSHYICQQV